MIIGMKEKKIINLNNNFFKTNYLQKTMISVIGAGPAGLFYASKAKQDVHIFEEHKEVGKPVACTGILTDSIKEIINIKQDLIINKINQFKIIAPNNQSTYINLKKPNLIIDRYKFDQFLLEKALDNNAKLHLNERFLDFKNSKLKTSKNTYKTDTLIGADGPLSKVAKISGLFKNRKFLPGLQARVKYKDLEEHTTIIKLNLGEFSWVVPEDNKIARVGIIGSNIQKEYQNLIKNYKVLETQSGVIPLYNPKQKFKKNNVYLIGDAATQVKATTYGGIIYGLLAAKHLAENNYPKKFKKLRKELLLSLKLRQLMNSMTESQYNELVKIFQKKNNIEILSKYNRDYPTKIILQLLKETKLWKLSFNILKNKLIN